MAKNVRAQAAKACFAIVDKGRSLSEELPLHQTLVAEKDAPLLQEIVYGVMRYLPELEHAIRPFITTPLKGKQRSAHFLMLVGVYQLKYMRVPDHAAVAETVAATKPLKQFHLKGLVNAVLRSYQRSVEQGESSAEVSDPIKYNHPSWLLNKLKTAYPEKWQQVVLENMSRPPMWLRVNKLKHKVSEYKALLADTKITVSHEDKATGALLLEKPNDVNALPHFSDGGVSIQDGAAQQAAVLLEAQAGESILDCCAAPGGKTCHIMELEPNLRKVTAIDISEDRLVRVQENFDRLSLSAQLITADASTQDWWDGELFDRILLDAPCSATGVIRRHPDIKWLRKANDIDALVDIQRLIFKNMWSMLKPGGTLLYATCSVLPEENTEQVNAFVNETPDAELIDLQQKSGHKDWQILPNESGMDGFYYAKLRKAI